MYDQFAAFYGNLSIARTIYSLILISIILLLASHLISIWSTGKISISDFSYFSNGKKDSDHAEQLRSETYANYSMIVGLIKSYEMTLEQSSEPAANCQTADNSWYRRIINMFKKQGSDRSPGQTRDCDNNNQSAIDVTTLALMNDLQSDELGAIAKTLDITVEGISLKGLFSAFGNLVAPPKTELIASIYESDNTKRAYVAVAGDSSSRTMKELTTLVPTVSSLDTPGKDGDSAFRIACYLIWIQLNKNSEQAARRHVSFEEFCDWAKILGIRNTLETTESYRMEDRKKSLDIDFIKRRMSLAARREIGFRDTYGPLSDFTDFIGGETIKLDDKTEATVDAVADLVRYFGLIGGKIDDDDENDYSWLTSLVSPVTSRQTVNEAYFKRFISTDCNPDDGLPKALIGAKLNIVQIASLLTTGRKVITTGLIIEDGQVLTYYSDQTSGALLPDRFKNATVNSAECGSAGNPAPVTAAKLAVPNGKAPYAILTVPGLKRRGELPELNFAGPVTGGVGSPVFVAGILAEPQAMFTGIQSHRDNEVPPQGKRMIHFISGRAFADFDSNPLGNDGERRFYLSAPFARALVGSPIVDEFGSLVGFVGFGTSVGKNLTLSVGSAMTTLRDMPSLKTKESVKKESR